MPDDTVTRAILPFLVCVACGGDATLDGDARPGPDPDAPDASTHDGPAGVDARSDAGPVDTVAPQLLGVMPEPDTAAWLHEPFRFTFDEAVAIEAATAVASLDGDAIDATLALADPATVIVTLAASARGVGTLELRLDGIEDLAGNAVPDPIVVGHDVPAWSGRPVTGAAGGSPALAVTADGAVVAAWPVGSAGARRLAVRRLVSGEWLPLGAVLGSADVTSYGLALDDADRPVVAFVEGGTAYAARWAGDAWQDLPSPGAGAHVALAAPPDGGAVVAAVFGSNAAVARLAGTTWDPIGGPVDVPGTIVGEPAIAAGSATAVAIAWIDNTGGVRRLRAHRHTGAWAAITPIVVDGTATHRLDLAARGTKLAVAWDQTAGSSAVLAAQASGAATTWARLGRLLDVDAAGDAVAPAIAIETGGAPVVAWTELIETSQRGIVARWTGSRWDLVGGVTWLSDPGTPPTRARLALADGKVPVVGWSAGGELGVARWNGPKNPAVGIAQRAPMAGCAFSAANPPATVLATGCFTIPTPGVPVPHAGLVPYDIVSELWSDGARKRRWIGLPDGATMTMSATGAWAPPNGTVIVKEFAIETTPGDPDTRIAIETRYLVRDATLGWRGFSYRWRVDGTNADLITDGQQIGLWTTTEGTHAHVYPSRSHCLSCHENSYGPMLGIRPPQLARWVDYGGVIADQLDTLAHLDVGPASTATPFVSPHDPSQTAEQRTRSYMAANCAHCHNPSHISVKDLRYTTPLADTKLCEVIVPGSPAQSEVFQRVTSRPGMPPLATLEVDPLAEDILGAWISGMTSCP